MEPWYHFDRSTFPATITALVTDPTWTSTDRAAAIEDESGSVSYPELARRVDDVARRIAGVTAPGDAVALLATNDADGLIAQFGIMAVGRVAVTVDLRDPSARRRRLFDLTDPRAFVTTVHHAPDDPAAVWTALADLAPTGRVDPGAVHPDDRAAVFQTSGTTGLTKLVPRTQYQLASGPSPFNLRSVDAHCRFAFTYPVAFPGAAICATIVWLQGGTVRFLDPTALGAAGIAVRLAEDGITHFFAPSTLHRAVADEVLARSGPLEHMVEVGFGGEPVTPADLALAGEAYPTAFRTAYYGTQEHGTIAATQYASGDALPDGPAPAGRIVCWGPFVATEYIGDPAATAAQRVDLDGRAAMATGDLGVVGPDGDLHVVGRTSQRVKILGEGVDALEVETALRSLPGIADAVVSAVPDERTGHRLVAHLTGPDAVDDVRRIRELLADRLPAHMAPRRVLTYDELPRTGRDKADRPTLDALAALPEAPIRPAGRHRVALGPQRVDLVSVVLQGVPDTAVGPLLSLTVDAPESPAVPANLVLDRHPRRHRRFRRPRTDVTISLEPGTGITEIRRQILAAVEQTRR